MPMRHRNLLGRRWISLARLARSRLLGFRHRLFSRASDGMGVDAYIGTMEPRRDEIKLADEYGYECYGTFHYGAGTRRER